MREYKKQRDLEKALHKAMEWQNNLVPDEKVTAENGHEYIGPHKWIICLIGCDDYTV